MLNCFHVFLLYRSFPAFSRLATLGLIALSAFQVQAERVWGVNGHPNYQEYRVWLPAEVKRQYDYLDDLGAGYYRVSFSESKNDPSVLASLFPESRNHTPPIQLLPIIFVDPVPSAGYQSNYDAGYAHGKRWADYALNAGFNITHWELGNETSLASIKVRDRSSNDPNATKMVPMFKKCDGCLGINESEWTYASEFPGAYDAMAGVLRGMYWGVKNAYKARGKSVTLLFGDTWAHFGYVRKIMSVRNANFFPGDVLSWHWYSPSFNNSSKGFTTPLIPGYSNTIPAILAKGFGKDIWMTEIGREDKQRLANGTYRPIGGSAVNVTSPDQNWSFQATELQALLNDLITIPEIKAIFVYQLYDEKYTFATSSMELRSSQAYYGLVAIDGLNMQENNINYYTKDAFITYKNFIRVHP